jgi:hypothetical protein
LGEVQERVAARVGAPSPPLPTSERQPFPVAAHRSQSKVQNTLCTLREFLQQQKRNKPSYFFLKQKSMDRAAGACLVVGQTGSPVVRTGPCPNSRSKSCLSQWHLPAHQCMSWSSYGTHRRSSRLRQPPVGAVLSPSAAWSAAKQPGRVAAADITETNRMHLVLSRVQNRTVEPYFISHQWDPHSTHETRAPPDGRPPLAGRAVCAPPAAPRRGRRAAAGGPRGAGSWRRAACHYAAGRVARVGGSQPGAACRHVPSAGRPACVPASQACPLPSGGSRCTCAARACQHG